MRPIGALVARFVVFRTITLASLIQVEHPVWTASEKSVPKQCNPLRSMNEGRYPAALFYAHDTAISPILNRFVRSRMI